MGGRSHLSGVRVDDVSIVKGRQSRSLCGCSPTGSAACRGFIHSSFCLCLQRFHPTSPVILTVVTGGSPSVVRPFVGFQDHGVDPSPAQVDESLFRCFQQGGGDALPTAVRVYGQPVGGASPTVESGYDGSREETVTLGEEQGFGVS